MTKRNNCHHVDDERKEILAKEARRQKRHGEVMPNIWTIAVKNMDARYSKKV
jgi:hypothetical protein